jgi:hypothetical protein
MDRRSGLCVDEKDGLRAKEEVVTAQNKRGIVFLN